MLLCLGAIIFCDCCGRKIIQRDLSFLADDSMYLPIEFVLEAGGKVHENRYFYCKECTLRVEPK